MKHLFVPYELALLAKEKGFNEDCLAIWSKRHHNDTPTLIQKNWNSGRQGSLDLFAPLYQQLEDWFREGYNLWIMPCQKIGFGWEFKIYSSSTGFDVDTNGNIETKHKDFYGSYNLALTEAFKLINP